MKSIIHKANTRGYFDHGWLQTRHTFSFAGYYNSDRTHFGKLRVLNDDIIGPGEGFGTHPHENMEIVSIPISGALAHKDSQGHKEVIRENDIQVMSAGTGIQHSEYNASTSEPANFLQIWIFPNAKGRTPRYDQKTFNPEKRKNQFQVVVSPEKSNGSLWLNQDTWFVLTDLEQGKELEYNLHSNTNGVYLFVIDGKVTIAKAVLEKRDGLAVWETKNLQLQANEDAKLLLIEIPMH